MEKKKVNFRLRNTNLTGTASVKMIVLLQPQGFTNTPTKNNTYRLQLFRQTLSHKSVQAYATMPIGILGRKSLALID